MTKNQDFIREMKDQFDPDAELVVVRLSTHLTITPFQIRWSRQCVHVHQLLVRTMQDKAPVLIDLLNLGAPRLCMSVLLIEIVSMIQGQVLLRLHPDIC
jgi:hypothetical protein